MSFADLLDPEYRALYETLRNDADLMEKAETFFVRPDPDVGYSKAERADAFALLTAGVLQTWRHQTHQPGVLQGCAPDRHEHTPLSTPTL